MIAQKHGSTTEEWKHGSTEARTDVSTDARKQGSTEARRILEALTFIVFLITFFFADVN